MLKCPCLRRSPRPSGSRRDWSRTSSGELSFLIGRAIESALRGSWPIVDSPGFQLPRILS